MCMSALEQGGEAHHYFADYEAWSAGMPVAWGHVTLTYRVPEDGCFQPADVLALIRERAALQQDVKAVEIRVRSLGRL